MQGAIKVRLLSIDTLIAEKSFGHALVIALRDKKSIFHQTALTSIQGVLYAYRRLGNTDQVIETILDTKRYFDEQEISALQNINNVNTGVFIITIIAIWLLPFWWNSRKLSKMAHHLGQGNLDVPVTLSRYASLYPIAKALQTLATRVQSLIDSHKSLVNSAAHELRTPLTRLKYAQHLAHEARDSGERQHYLREAEREVAVLDSLIDELLFYAKLDRQPHQSPQFTTQPAEQWLAACVASARGLAAAVAPDSVIEYRSHATIIIGDSSGLTRIANNLLANALRYARNTVRISIEETPGSFSLTVEDDGDGIPEAEMTRVFEPFVRLDSSRQKCDDSNYGLGLSIVARIAEQHAGTAHAMKSTLGGARIVVTWPRQATIE